ncbi:MAG: hypothetical protein FWD65_04025 [Coriobacteriia bacterium]|nr:hypothetical protein [Coriobacteriia bacterium]
MPQLKDKNTKRPPTGGRVAHQATAPASSPAVVPVFSLHTVTATVFLLLAFLAPGAWLIYTIPVLEKGQLCFLLATLICVALVCARLLPLRRPTQSALLAAGLMTAAFLLALVTNAFPVQQFFYDLYGEMPGYLWLCYPVIFLLAASIGLGKWVRPALRVVTLVGLLLIAVALCQRFFTTWVTVFGSSAYNVSALIPIPVLALWLASVDTDQRLRILWRITALISAVAIAVISYGMLGIFAVIALVLLIAALRPQLFGLSEGRLCGRVRLGGRMALGLLVLALVVALLPPVSGLIVKRQDLASLGSTVGSRMEFTYGAQAMVAKRPLTGYGPAGYRFSSYRYISNWLYGDTGSIGSDPTAYSPPSPHSLPWEVVTRLGLIGAVAFLIAGYFWLRDSLVLDNDFRSARRTRRPRHTSELDNDFIPNVYIDFRAACAIATLAWLLSLFVTPMHFASGLLGAALAGLACARPEATGMDALSLPSAGKTIARIVGLLALVIVAVFFMRQQFALSSAQTLSITAQDDLTLQERAARSAPANPLVERRILQDRLMLASTPQELNTQIQAIPAAPGYITDFTLNATLFARLALNQMQALHTADAANVTAVTALLKQAGSAGPVTPALLGEQLHLAQVSGNAAALRQAIAAVKQPRFNGKNAIQLYAPISHYLSPSSNTLQ